jgi:hypothetical protein
MSHCAGVAGVPRAALDASTTLGTEVNIEGSSGERRPAENNDRQRTTTGREQRPAENSGDTL